MAFALASLPWSADLLRRPRTPFDNSAAGPAVASGYVLLRNAGASIPEGSTVVVQTEPRDSVRESYFHRFAVALLPGARVLPAAFYGQPADPSVFRDAEFVIVVGIKPAVPPGELLLDTPEGSVWRRHRQ